MSRCSRRSLALRLTALCVWVVSALALGACGPSPCTRDGREIAHGSSVPAGDGCNTCSCNDGELFCTAIGCAPAGPPPAP